MNNIETLVVKLSNNPFNPKFNFDCAVEYEKLNQTASAVSFYLRAAEYGYDSDPEIVYTSLLKMSKCFDDQNDRDYTVTNCLLQAIAYLPSRPEAYFLMSVYHEQLGQWQESYTWANIGLQHTEQKVSLPVDTGYLSRYSLLFQKAVSSWWIGRRDESIEIFNMINNEYNSMSSYIELIRSNMKIIGE